MDPSITALAESPAGGLRAKLGDKVILDAHGMQGYLHDEAPHVPFGTPAAVVRAAGTDDVVATLRYAHERGIPVVPRGAGYGLAGGANATDGCIVLSLAGMQQIVEIDTESMVAVAEPGVVNADLRSAAAERNLFYAPDPSSYEFSTIGGNIATNAGGLCCAKYGVTRDSVLGIRAVLADGTELQTGHLSVKGVAGYDLTALLTGSEGTLAVITQATLRLRPLPPPPLGIIATFPTASDAARAATAIRQMVVPSLLELMDDVTVAAIEAWKHPGLGAGCVLLAQSDAGAQATEDVSRMRAVCEQLGASSVLAATEPDEATYMLSVRRMAIPALERTGTTLLDDVAVPFGRLATLVDGVQEIAQRHGVAVAVFGHVGDGNMHPTLVYDAADERSVAASRAAFDDIVRLALRLGGTCTGEHGVGLLKRKHLEEEMGPVSMELQRGLKRLFDPGNILNPGKVL